MLLAPKLKCLVKFVRDKCDLSGVWSPNWAIIKIYIGEPVNELELLSIDSGRQFKKIDNGKIYCIGFVEFQYGLLSPKSPVHRKVLNILATHKIDYKYPINRVKEEDKEEEEDEDKEKQADWFVFISGERVDDLDTYMTNNYQKLYESIQMQAKELFNPLVIDFKNQTLQKTYSNKDEFRDHLRNYFNKRREALASKKKKEEERPKGIFIDYHTSNGG